MFGLENIPVAMMAIKYIVVMIIGIKIFTLTSSFLTTLTDEEFISQLIALAIAILTIYLVSEMFIIVLIIFAVILYLTGKLKKLYVWLQ